MTAKSYIEDLMYGRRKSFLAGSLLTVLSSLYGAMVRVRRMAYVCGILSSKKLGPRVISVGNITLGGTGKTPTVINITGLLLKNRMKPVVLSRGYGRKDESEVLVVSDGTAVIEDPEAGGDEPGLMATKLPGAPVVVGKDRYQAGRVAVDRFNSDTIVLDDGFQHLRLKRDLDIVLVDAMDPFGIRKLFPAGILREPLSSLKRAHIVLITRSDKSKDLDALKAELKRYTKAELFLSRHAPVDLVDATTNETKALSALKGSPVFAFSGIARPASFTSLLRSLGAEVKAETSYPDHYQYKKSDLAAIYQKAVDSRASMIVTTEKDAIRLKHFKPDGIWALRIELKVIENEQWEKVILHGK